ncbi:hypothetical protein BH10PSE6_BH10PSE6_31140 [soil metagenome]
MAKQLTSSDRDQGDDLILAFYNEEPIEAGELGALFSALARDYRQLTRGRTLVVTRVEAGSLIVILRDLLSTVGSLTEVANAAKAIYQFASAIYDLIQREKTDDSVLDEPEQKPWGDRTIEEITKIAARSRSEVKARYVGRYGDSFELQVSNAEARDIREKRKRRKPAARERQGRLAGPDALQALPDPQGAVNSLINLRTLGAGFEEIRTMAEVLVSVLKSAGASYLLSQIASDLEIAGHSDLARMIREADDQPRLEPPLAS